MAETTNAAREATPASPPHPRPARRWAMALALLALPLAAVACHRSTGGAAAAASGSTARAGTGAAPTGTGAAPTGTGAAPTGSAAGDAGSGTAAAAAAADDSLPDASVAEFNAALPTVNPEGLDGHQRAEILRITGDVLCQCGEKPTTLAGALRQKVPCVLARRMVQLAGIMVHAGLSPLEATNALEQYYGGFAPQGRAMVTIDPKSCEGPVKAPVTLVEFADFQCPHCKHAFPLIHKVVAHFKGKVRWCYVNFPLPMHPEAREAAELAEMAKTRGKFFEMASLLFEHQDSLSRGELVKLGQKVGFTAQAVTEALDERTYEPIVKHQFEEAVHLGLEATPTVFINGRKLTLPIQLLPWAIDDELLFQAHGNSWNG